jgi:hypothetical protein
VRGKTGCDVSGLTEKGVSGFELRITQVPVQSVPRLRTGESLQDRGPGIFQKVDVALISFVKCVPAQYAAFHASLNELFWKKSVMLDFVLHLLYTVERRLKGCGRLRRPSCRASDD